MYSKDMYQDGQRVVFKVGEGTFFGVMNELNEDLTDATGEPHYWVYETTAGFRQPVNYKNILRTR